MPELPEVETIRLQLLRKIVGRKLNGKEVTNVRRRAKILIIDFRDNSSLILHLKLTGQLIFNGKILPYTRKIFKFDDDSRLIFNDARKFGWWKKVKNTKEIEKRLGPEPLKINFKTFKNLLAKRPKAKIKPLLMNQEFIAGIGNIYSDEILYAAKIHPLRCVNKLNDKEIKSIFQNIKKILLAAIKYQGSSVEYYVDACGKRGNFVKHHRIYRKEGQPCKRCGTKIERLKMGGRSAHYCPKCQKL